MIDNLVLSQKPWEQQAEIHAFLRGGLTNPTPIKVAKAEECTYLLDTRAQEVMERLKGQLGHGEWFGSMEVYENGFNLFVRHYMSEHAVRVWRYRVEA